MKKLLLTLGLAALTVAGARADGTISFLPGTAGRVTMPGDDGGSQPVNFPFYVAVYWSADGNNWNPPVEPFGIGSATTGLFSVAGNGSFYVIPGTEEFQTVSMLIYAWQASYGDDPYAAWQAGLMDDFHRGPRDQAWGRGGARHSHLAGRNRDGPRQIQTAGVQPGSA